MRFVVVMEQIKKYLASVEAVTAVKQKQLLQRLSTRRGRAHGTENEISTR